MDYSPDACSLTANYAELHCISNFTFLRGASHPEELVRQASQLGYKAIAITDECSLSGVVRAHTSAKQYNIKLIIGAEFKLLKYSRLVLLATDRSSYGRLSYLITQSRKNSEKGQYEVELSLLQQHTPKGCIALWAPHPSEPVSHKTLSCLRTLFKDDLWIAVELLLTGDDGKYLIKLQEIARQYELPLCAAGNVHMHCRSRKPLQDTLSAIRLGVPISQLGFRSQENAECHLRNLEQIAQIYPRTLLNETIRIAERCRFSLDELRYQYPKELIPEQHTPFSWLHHLTYQGAKQRWPEGISQKHVDLIKHELNLIEQLHYEAYFLTVHDIVQFAKSQGILCQGRGSAANSIICYCLGITEVNPQQMEMLFERFISKERNEPPDIDVDFEHQRREEVIQYIYNKYGRDRAALAATVITYQARSAIRDVGKALGMNLDQVDRLAKTFYWWDDEHLLYEHLQQNGFHPNNPIIQRLIFILKQIIGFPRHLSQHVGGFVISQDKLDHLVPIENATMPERSVIQWEKDDLESLGLLKVDVLALGMLTAIRKALDMISKFTKRRIGLDNVPPDDPEVYKMIQKADTIGVFQIESRAQMSMLPRLRPANYYDLVIQIAIVRPGPIQGDMVHPYLDRRKHPENVRYPNPAIERVLKRTLGVPIFQEQVMQLAMVAAGFSAGEADELRRSMAAWKRKGGLEKFEHKLREGMRKRGYSERFAAQIYSQIKGFGDYGFPESHSASFALLAYVSSWLKHYHPAAFTCALLNSQPMGFYAPPQLIQDAQRHGVTVLPVDVNHSCYDCTLELPQNIHANNTKQSRGVRLGLRMVKGLSSEQGKNIEQARVSGEYQNLQDLVARAGLQQHHLQCLAAADALHALSGDRHQAYWQVSGVEAKLPLFGNPIFNETDVLLGKPTEGQNILADYSSTGVSLRSHPIKLLRAHLDALKVTPSALLHQCKNNAFVCCAGLVIGRQRPGSASGVLFITLEDDTGYANIIVWPKIFERYRKIILSGKLLVIGGQLQLQDNVLHLIARRVSDHSHLLGALSTRSRNFY